MFVIDVVYQAVSFSSKFPENLIMVHFKVILYLLLHTEFLGPVGLVFIKAQEQW
jgi:hypothetical protein